MPNHNDLYLSNDSTDFIDGPPGGAKYDTGKPRMDLLDPIAMDLLAQAMTYGASKYDAHNWRKGIQVSRLTAALLRHLFSFMRGQDLDDESGLPHLAHVGACWMMLTNMWSTRRDLDDRYIDPSLQEDDIL